MSTFTTASGSQVSATQSEDGHWSVDGVTWGPGTEAQAAAFFLTFCPEGETPLAPPDPPPPLPPTTISTQDFMARLTQAESVAIAQAAQSNPMVLLWLIQLSNVPGGIIDVTSAALTEGVAGIVAGGWLTAARGSQLLNLAVASP